MKEAQLKLYASRRHVIIINEALQYDPSGLKDVLEKYEPMGNGGGYRVFRFKRGMFVNKGDGGWLNWVYICDGVERPDNEGMLIYK